MESVNWRIACRHNYLASLYEDTNSGAIRDHQSTITRLHMQWARRKRAKEAEQAEGEAQTEQAEQAEGEAEGGAQTEQESEIRAIAMMNGRLLKINGQMLLALSEQHTLLEAQLERIHAKVEHEIVLFSASDGIGRLSVS
jgi:hypothetical protein